MGDKSGVDVLSEAIRQKDEEIERLREQNSKALEVCEKAGARIAARDAEVKLRRLGLEGEPKRV